MSRSFKSVSTAALLVALAACGGSSSLDTETPSPSITQSGFNPGGLAATYDPVADTLTLTDGAETFVYNYLSSNGSVGRYDRNGTTYVESAFYSETSTASGSATAFVSTEDGYEAAAAVLERDGPTTLPSSGTVTYTGDYMGTDYQLLNGDPIVNYTVSGDMALEISFSGDPSVVSGGVTNRDGEARPYEDIVFDSVILDGTNFSGTMSGGEVLVGGPNTTADGTYSGMLTGATGGEAVGTLSLTHNTNVGQRFEIGIFVAE